MKMKHMKQKYVIIGASAAGIAAARTIRNLSQAEVTIISADESIYSRCMLHKFISGERSERELSFVNDNDDNTESFFSGNNIRFVSGVTVSGVDTKDKRVIWDNGGESYDKLLIATGSESVCIPIDGLADAANVCSLYNLSDAKLIREKASAANNSGNIVIVGAGLIGLDAAYALVELGKKPVIIDVSPSILSSNLDTHAASVYEAKFAEAGCSFRLGVKVSGVISDESNNVTNIVLESGEKLPCVFAIVAAGVHPAVGFLRNSGINCGRGVIVDEYMRTSEDGVFAAGDVTALSNSWSDAMKQGEAAAYNMCGIEKAYTDTFIQKNTLNFFGLQTLSAGRVIPSDGDEVYCREDIVRYEKIIVRDGVPVGVVLQGDISHSGFWQHMIKNKISISGIPKPIWKISFADSFAISKNGEYKWAEIRG